VSGSISLSGDIAASIQYVVDTTGVGTGTGMLMLGLQTDTARGIRVQSDGTVFVSHTGTANVSVVNAPTVTVSNLDAVTITTGTVDISNVVTISGTVDGTFAGGIQYVAGTTSPGASGTGTIFLGIQSTTARAVRLNTDGTVFVSHTGTANVSVVNEPVVSISTGTVDVVSLPAITGTVTSIPSNTGTIANILTVGTVLGIISISGTVDGTFGGGQQYSVGNTTPGATGTGTIFLGIQSTTARAIRLATDGTMFVSHTGTADVSITNIPAVIVNTGTMDVVSLPAITGTVTSIPSNTGTLSNILTVGTVLGTLAVSGSVSPLGQPFAVYNTHIGTQWNSGLVTITTSAAGMSGILKVSAANTPYVTDVIVSVDVPMNVQLRSATTAMAILYLATKGGMVANFKTPMVCTTAQSFTFIPSASGSCSVWAAGYTVT
jgi:hypothetical protein